MWEKHASASSVLQPTNLATTCKCTFLKSVNFPTQRSYSLVRSGSPLARTILNAICTQIREKVIDNHYVFMKTLFPFGWTVIILIDDQNQSFRAPGWIPISLS